MDLMIPYYIKEKLTPFLRTGFVHNGRTPGVELDCLGFVVLFYKKFGFDFPDGDGRPIHRHWFKQEPDRMLDGLKTLGFPQVKTIEELRPFDLVGFAVARNIMTHMGVMVSSRHFAHMAPRNGFRITLLDNRWAAKVKIAFRPYLEGRPLREVVLDTVEKEMLG
mgnify:FL=1